MLVLCLFASSLTVLLGKQVVTGKSADGFLSFDPVYLICRFPVTSVSFLTVRHSNIRAT